MSHPENRFERFVVGQYKAKKRVSLMFSEKFCREHPDVVEGTAQRHRDTTKRCGKPCCSNPRHNGFKDRLTRQEKRFEEFQKD
ncbi:MAG: hypothetical protein IMZ64_04085 [Bacteroidetes bacterium]|nr:hypothetical protein [Bacteroidota bacterium]